MKKILLPLALVLSTLVHAGSSRFSADAPPRHDSMLQFYNSGQWKYQDPNFWDWRYMTGNWNGNRAKLAKHGITISGSFGTEVMGNPSGGEKQGMTYVGSLGLDLRVNLDKLTSWPGGTFFSSFVFRTGTSLSSKKIINQFPVQQMYGSQTYKLNELYLEQKLYDGDLTFKLGRLDQGNDFLASPLYGLFVNNGFCGNPIAVFFNNPSLYTAYPNSTWGSLCRSQSDSSNFGEICCLQC